MQTTQTPRAMKPGKTAGDMMVTRMVTLEAGMNVVQAARRLVKQRIGSAPVIDPDTSLPVGELSRQSCLDALLEAVYEGSPTRKVASYMIPWNSTVGENSSIVEMVEKFRGSPQKFLPVCRDKKFLGVVTRSALTRALLALLENLPDHQSRTLYLSAIHDPDEAPGL